MQLTRRRWSLATRAFRMSVATTTLYILIAAKHIVYTLCTVDIYLDKCRCLDDLTNRVLLLFLIYPVDGK